MKNYFELLGLSVSFNQEIKELDTNYHNAQKLAHPDKTLSKSDEDRHSLTELSTNLNVAYKTIKNPVSRAEYLYFLLFNENVGSNQFLDINMEALDLREEYETTDDKTEFLNKVTLMFNDSLTDVERAFLENKTKEECDKSVQRLKFMYKLVNTVKESM